MHQQTSWNRRGLLLLVAVLLVGGLPGEGAERGRALPELRLTAGRVTVLSFSSVREVQILAIVGAFDAEVLTRTAVRLAAHTPGEAVLRVRTSSGWEAYALRAPAAAPVTSALAAGDPRPFPLTPIPCAPRLSAPPPRAGGGLWPALSLGPHPLAATVVTIAGLPDPPRAGRSAAGRLVADARPSVPVILGAQLLPRVEGSIPRLPAPAEPAVGPPVPLSLAEGRSRIVPADGVHTVQIDDPSGAIADVQPLSDTEVLILAKGPGVTTVRVWDRRGRTDYEVTVTPGPARQQKAIQEAIGAEGVTVRVVESTAILEGEVANLEQLARAQRIAEAFVPKVVNLLRTPAPPAPAPPVPDLAALVQAVLPAGEVTAEALPGQPSVVILRGLTPRVEDIRAIEEVANVVAQKVGGTVVNLIQIAQPRQVRVQARMLNLDERLLKDLGVQWNDEATWGQAVAGGEFRMLTAIQANLRTLIEDSRAEVLAEPSIVVNSGAVGHITIGGEVPIPSVVTGLTTSNQAGVGTIGQSAIFRPFGVQLGIEPVVEPGEEITLRLVAESSSIDRSTSVNIGGSNVPGFTTKRAATELRLAAGQTLVIGGLISRDDAEAVRKFPILADIPIFGAFFRSVRKEKQSRELVLFLTLDTLPGPEPPAGLRQTPALRPDGALSTVPTPGIGVGIGGSSGAGVSGGGLSGGTQGTVR